MLMIVGSCTMNFLLNNGDRAIWEKKGLGSIRWILPKRTRQDGQQEGRHHERWLVSWSNGPRLKQFDPKVGNNDGLNFLGKFCSLRTRSTHFHKFIYLLDHLDHNRWSLRLGASDWLHATSRVGSSARNFLCHLLEKRSYNNESV